MQFIVIIVIIVTFLRTRGRSVTVESGSYAPVC